MSHELAEFVKTFLYAFSSLFPVVNPIGAALFFLSMTNAATREERNMLSLRIAVYCFLMTMASMWAGSFILSFFGISLPVLRVAGGLVLISAGWTTLNSPATSTSNQEPMRPVNREELVRKAFYPFTLPLTIGPGTIAVCTAMGSSTEPTFGNISGVTVAAFAVCLTIWLCFRYSDRITARLGATGSDAITRIFSFILICIGVQILWTGVSGLVLDLSQKI